MHACSSHLHCARISDIHKQAAGPTHPSLLFSLHCPDSTEQMNSGGYHSLEDFPCLTGTLCCHQAVGQSTDLGGIHLFPAGTKLQQQPLGFLGTSRSSGLSYSSPLQWYTEPLFFYPSHPKRETVMYFAECRAWIDSPILNTSAEAVCTFPFSPSKGSSIGSLCPFSAYTLHYS